ncbi:hypothetical protein EV122DRAFT_267013 [Schizophyllum commune]
MIMTSLNFVDKGLLNSSLCLDDGRVQFTTKTKRNWIGRTKETRLLRGTSDSSVASIQWRNKAFEINDKTYSIKQLRTKSSCWTQKSQWQWGSRTYSVKWKKGGWMIFPPSSSDPIATLKPRKLRLFHKDVPARVTLPSSHYGSLSDDALFFLVLLIYLQATKERNEGKAEAAGAAGDIAGAVASVAT